MKLKLINGYLKAYDYEIIKYTNDYYNKLTDKYENDKNKQLNNEINKARTEIVNNYCSVMSLLDYGCGTGNFIKYHEINGKCYTYGYELIPKTVTWLKENDMYIDPYKNIPSFISGVSMWDVFEHLEDHKKLLNNFKKDMYLFITIPIFNDLDKVKESTHYIPNEHLWYFTENSFIDYMASFNFNTLEVRNDEELLGRNQIKTFVLQKI